MDLTGQPLPPFSLQDHLGQTHSPESLAGHWVILYAYPKDATPGCTQEACDFRDNWAHFQAKGFFVLGVSRDSPSSHERFASKQELPFPLLTDPDASLLAALGAFGPKTLYGKTRDGILRSTFLVDPTGRIRRVWSMVKVKGHVQEILDALNEFES